MRAVRLVVTVRACFSVDSWTAVSIAKDLLVSLIIGQPIVRRSIRHRIRTLMLIKLCIHLNIGHVSLVIWCTVARMGISDLKIMLVHASGFYDYNGLRYYLPHNVNHMADR